MWCRWTPSLWFIEKVPLPGYAAAIVRAQAAAAIDPVEFAVGRPTKTTSGYASLLVSGIEVLLVAALAWPASAQVQFDDLIPPKRIWPLEGSYAKCILDEMPGVVNDTAAAHIHSMCKGKYPEQFRTIESGGLLGFKDPAECIAKKARDTSGPMAVRLIAAACYHRYRVKE